MTSNLVRIPAVASLGVAAAFALAACGSSGSSPSAPANSAASTPAGASSQPSAAKGTPETATETEFHIALSSKTLKPGTYTYTVKNAGSITHALTVDGPGVSGKTTGDISPGSSATLTVTLKAGSYDIFCPVGNHKMEGMDETVKVA